jgi:hypothetical protein
MNHTEQHLSRADRKANQAFAVYASHMRKAFASPSLHDDPQWCAKRDETYRAFIDAFGASQ